MSTVEGRSPAEPWFGQESLQELSVEWDSDNLVYVARTGGPGWTVAPDAPVLAFLPAIWPENDRTWVPDPMTRTLWVSCDGEVPRSEPWGESDYAEWAAEQAEVYARVGATPPPHGRVWILRGPPRKSVEEIIDQIYCAAEHVSGAPPNYRKPAESVIEREWGTSPGRKN